MQALLDHPWQGNVRELNHVVERSVLMARMRSARSPISRSAASPTRPTRSRT